MAELLVLHTCSTRGSVGNEPGVWPDTLMNNYRCVTLGPEGMSEVTWSPDVDFMEEEMGETTVGLLCVHGKKKSLPNLCLLLHPVPRRTAPPACAPGPSFLAQMLGAHAAQP